MAIPGGKPYPGWSWRAAVPGSSPAYSRILDRVDIATGGEADGEGELVPPPLSPPLQPSYFSPATPTLPAPAALLPRPGVGRGQCLRYQGSSRIRGGASRPPCQVLRRLIPGYWTVWISPRGEGPTGRGNLFPLPCLSCLQPSYPSAGRPPIRSLPAPHPARACGKGYPYPSGGGVRA